MDLVHIAFDVSSILWIILCKILAHLDHLKNSAAVAGAKVVGYTPNVLGVEQLVDSLDMTICKVHNVNVVPDAGTVPGLVV